MKYADEAPGCGRFDMFSGVLCVSGHLCDRCYPRTRRLSDFTVASVAFEAGRADMARAFWAAVCEQMAKEADDASAEATRATWHRLARRYDNEAAQLRAWAREAS